MWWKVHDHRYTNKEADLQQSWSTAREWGSLLLGTTWTGALAIFCTLAVWATVAVSYERGKGMGEWGWWEGRKKHMHTIMDMLVQSLKPNTTKQLPNNTNEAIVLATCLCIWVHHIVELTTLGEEKFVLATFKTYCIWWCTSPSRRNIAHAWGTCICPADTGTMSMIRHTPYRCTDSSFPGS